MNQLLELPPTHKTMNYGVGYQGIGVIEDSVCGANGKGRSFTWTPTQTEARSKIVAVRIQAGPGKPVARNPNKPEPCCVEDRHLVVPVHGRRIEFMAQAEVQGKIRPEIPVVLNEEIVRARTHCLRVVVDAANNDGRKAKEQISQRVACKAWLEDELAAGKDVIEPINLKPANVAAGFECMLAPDPCDVVNPLKCVVMADDRKRGIVRQPVKARNHDGRHAEVGGFFGEARNAERAGQIISDVLLQDLAAQPVVTEAELVQEVRAEYMGL